MFNNKTDVFDRVDKALGEAFEVVTNDFWNILDHADFPFITLESTTNVGRNFPPYNITELKNGQTRLDLAVAGYTRDLMSVEMQENTLIIRGGAVVASDKLCSTESVPVYDAHTASGTVRKQGISGSRFLRTFTVQPHTRVDSVRLQDGILSILVSTLKPEATKTKFEIK